MKPFAELTWRGKERRLRSLALKGLEQYPLQVREVRLLGVFTNMLYWVYTRDGQRLVLRVCRPGWRTDTDLFSEAAWLHDLAGEAEIGAPVPWKTISGDWLARAGVEEVDGERRMLLMSSVPGVSLEKRLTLANLEEMGKLFARLHRQSLAFQPPPDFTQLKMSSPFGRGERIVLWEDQVRTTGVRHDWEVIDDTCRQVEQAFASLYENPAGMRVIHNDLWHGNIKVNRSRLHPLDFEDTIWGYPVQDLAMALQDLMMDVEPEQFEPMQEALRRGYEQLSPWPEQYANQIDLFRAGRLLWVANYVAINERQYLGEHLERTAGLLRGFLETDQLRKLAGGS